MMRISSRIVLQTHEQLQISAEKLKSDYNDAVNIVNNEIKKIRALISSLESAKTEAQKTKNFRGNKISYQSSKNFPENFGSDPVQQYFGSAPRTFFDFLERKSFWPRKNFGVAFASFGNGQQKWSF